MAPVPGLGDHTSTIGEFDPEGKFISHILEHGCLHLRGQGHFYLATRFNPTLQAQFSTYERNYYIQAMNVVKIARCPWYIYDLTIPEHAYF